MDYKRIYNFKELRKYLIFLLKENGFEKFNLSTFYCSKNDINGFITYDVEIYSKKGYDNNIISDLNSFNNFKIVIEVNPFTNLKAYFKMGYSLSTAYVYESFCRFFADFDELYLLNLK